MKMNKKIVIFGLVTTAIVLAGVLVSATLISSDDSVLSIQDAVKIADETLMPLKGIVGVGITDDNPTKITVMIESEEYRSLVPEKIAGYETEVEVTGPIWAL